MRCWHYVRNPGFRRRRFRLKQHAGRLRTSWCGYGFTKLDRDPFKAPIGSILVYNARALPATLKSDENGFVSDFRS